MDMYLDHFGLSERPFLLLPDPDFIFWSEAHKRAFDFLEYGLYTGAPITLITGEIGAGKTILLRHLLRTLDDDLTVGMVSNAQGGQGSLLRWVMMALDQPVPNGADHVDVFERFQTFLIDEYASGRRVVLIFDEAQNLDMRMLEELRLYTNINTNKDELIKIVLVGQPELRDMLRDPSLVQFAQRIMVNVHLRAMDVAMVRDYIRHRLGRAGAVRDIFTEQAMDMIARASRGVPRLINQIADFALVYAASDGAHEVACHAVRDVLRDGVVFSDVLFLENSAAS